MKAFQAPFISGELANGALNPGPEVLDQLEKQQIDNLLWSANGYKPDVFFTMAYTSDSILLKYTVKEKDIRAVYHQTDDPVYKDTCVEAFIAFNGEDSYYNLEFNCIGTARVGYGPGKLNRVAISKQLVESIKTYHRINDPADDNQLTEWQLTLAIPFTVFEDHDITSLQDQVAKVNFYKCGDELPEPHFLSWNYIDNPYPEFHLPQFFGEVKFLP